jgi:hypothetical protein
LLSSGKHERKWKDKIKINKERGEEGEMDESYSGYEPVSGPLKM